MKTVDIKYLRDHFSEFLKFIKEGEVVYVRENDKVIAELRKPDVNYESQKDRINKLLMDWNEKGKLTPATQRSTLLRHPSEVTQKFSLDWMDIYQKDRS